MSPWLDGLSVLADEWQLVAVVLVCVFAGQALTGALLTNLFGDGLTSSDRLALGLAGWAVPASLLSLVWYFTGFDGLFWIIPPALLLALFLRLKSDRQPVSATTGLFLLIFLFISIPLRLAYASKTAFPLYFDSAQHYLIVKNILGGDLSLPAYYHLGYHFLAALIASASHAEVTRTMLVLGQLILATIPFSVHFLVRRVTSSNAAAWFALLLAAFGWYMPAHASDWGKYPALMSVGLLPFVLSLAYLTSKGGLSAKKRWILYGFLGLSGVLTVVTHSRSLIVLGIVVLAWVIVTRFEKRFPHFMFIGFLLVIVATVGLGLYILRQGILILLFDPYLSKGIPVTALVLLLSIFAWLDHPRLTLVSVLTMALLMAGLFVPVTFLPGFPSLTLLDRPYVEMILFLPLSVLGGLGLAGLEKKLPGRLVWGRFAGFLAIGFVVVNAFFIHDLYPSDCCVIVGHDDVLAMDWAADQLPVEARIGISSTQMMVISERPEGDAGADAGIWLTPLTGRVTVPLPNTSAFDQESTLARLCELGVGYLFVGETGQPFDSAKILSRPEWYRPLLSMPKTGVYEVIGCN